MFGALKLSKDKPSLCGVAKQRKEANMKSIYRLLFVAGVFLLASCGNQCGPGTYDNGNGCVYSANNYNYPYNGGYGNSSYPGSYQPGYPNYNYPGYYPH